MHDSVVSTPESLRNVLIDDIARRHYVLDADVVEHTTALATIEPTKNKEGTSLKAFTNFVMLTKLSIEQVKLLLKNGEESGVSIGFF